MYRLIAAAVAIMALLSACSDEIAGFENEAETTDNAIAEVNLTDKQETLTTFAKTLSAAISDRKDVREFLKEEALKQFDNNYDILYQLVKDQTVSGDETLQDILAEYSSEAQMEGIAANIPLLNIYLTRTAFLGIYPEDLDVDDSEIPVAVASADSTLMFFGGESEPALPAGEVPAFHVFVVGENSRVVASQQQTGSGNKSASAGYSFNFKSPAFDGSKRSNLKSVRTSASVLGSRAITAYSYFNGNGDGLNQKAFQRDYIYYGITPEKTSGTLVKSVSEYLCYLKVPVSAYFTISDEKENENSVYGDPYVKQNSYSKKGGRPTESDVINNLWQRGAYNFKVEIITSTESSAVEAYIPLTPEQLWKFNIKESHKHSTWFHRSRHTYTIDPKDFTANDVFLAEPIDLGKWHIGEESVFRYVRISEEDTGTEVTTEETFDMSNAKSSNVTGEVKVSVGMTDVTTNISTSAVNSSTTEKNTKVIKTKKVQDSDNLGTVRIYFYDPIIDSKSKSKSAPYNLHTYNTGSVMFGITAK